MMDADAVLEQENRDVVVLDDSNMPDLEEDVALKEYRLRMLSLLPTSKTVPERAVQEDLDANFDAFMEREYADDEIGDLDDAVSNEDQVTHKAIEEAVDEFIEDKKTWFRGLHKHYGDGEEAYILAPKNSE